MLNSDLSLLSSIEESLLCRSAPVRSQSQSTDIRVCMAMNQSSDPGQTRPDQTRPDQRRRSPTPNYEKGIAIKCHYVLLHLSINAHTTSSHLISCPYPPTVMPDYCATVASLNPLGPFWCLLPNNVAPSRLSSNAPLRFLTCCLAAAVTAGLC